jgi:uncharacterized protein (TIGR04551 family)
MRPSSISWLLLVLSLSAASSVAAQGTAGSPAPAPAAPSAPAPAPSAPAAPPAAAAPSAPAAAAPSAPSAAPSEPAAPSAGAAATNAAPETAPATAPAAGFEPPPGEATPPPAELPPASMPELPGVPTPGELGDRLVGDLPPDAAPKTGWTAPAPVLTLHGYLRVRGELQDTFWLGRAPIDTAFVTKQIKAGYKNVTLAGFGPDPFSRFRPLERSQTGLNCAGESTASDTIGRVCGVDTLQFATMRLRLDPQLNVSEDVRVRATFDVFDNAMLGQGPVGYYGVGNGAGTAFAGSDSPASSMIIARRAWAEVRNRDLGELRFGIMPQQWGLGMLYNAGNGLDDDYSTDLGRVMGITKIMGFYLSASYDFLAEGITGNKGGEYRPDFDASQIDDVDQFSFSIARRMPDEDEESVLERGDALLNGGLHFTIRNQDATLSAAPGATVYSKPVFETLAATYYTPDLWGQFRYKGLRLELESAAVLGTVHDTTTGKKYNVDELGAVLESELRLLDKKLGIYFYTGIATGDSDVEGLSSDANYISQLGNNTTVSTFRFHPSYRVDSILWRNIMRQVTGAYYFKPGISYDFVRNDFGDLFGARLDMIWSRAASFMQTPGNDPDLGIELNAQVYWRSDDGPQQDDGYHASLQYGVLFPMRGLGYYHRDASLDTAQTLRLLLGVKF